MRSLERLVLWAEHKMMQAEQRVTQLEQKALAAQQELTQSEIESAFDAEALAAQGAGGPTQTITFLLAQCSYPYPPFVGAAVDFHHDIDGLTYNDGIYVTDASGQITLTLIVGVTYMAYINKNGYSQVIASYVWPWPATFTRAMKPGFNCWPECPQVLPNLLYLTDQAGTTIGATPPASPSGPPDIYLAYWTHYITQPPNPCMAGNYTAPVAYLSTMWHTASAWARVVGGTITAVDMVDNGSGYVNVPRTPLGNADLTAVLAGDSVGSVTINNGGTFASDGSYALQFLNSGGIWRPDIATHPLRMAWGEALCRGVRVESPYAFVQTNSLRIKPSSVTCSPFVATYDFGPALTAIGAPTLPFPTGSTVVTLKDTNS